jgi:hypothetical protein
VQGRDALVVLVALVAIGCSRDDHSATATPPSIYGWWCDGTELVKITPDEIIRARGAGIWTAEVCQTKLDGKAVTFSRGEPFDRGGPVTATLDGNRLLLPGTTLVRASDSEALDYDQRAASALPPADICGRARDCYRAANVALAANQSLPLDATKDLGPNVGRTACAALLKGAAQTLEMQHLPTPQECK